jgi:tRNA(fMet)-specific endonuclease VapC
LSLLERNSADSLGLQIRLENVPADQIATTIVNYEEQMRGWLEHAARANSRERLLNAYSRLWIHVETFRGIPLLPFDERAVDEFEKLQKARIRIGSMDLKIASIALANQAVLLSRNLSDFDKVPGQRVEDWSV